MKFKCKKCGWCCRNEVINVSYSDFVRWQEMSRFDILKEVSFINNYPKKGVGGFYIVKTAFNPKQPCPFYQKGECSIHSVKPRSCKDYPLARKRCGCPAFKDDVSARGRIEKSQYKDFRNCVSNYELLMGMLYHARQA